VVLQQDGPLGPAASPDDGMGGLRLRRRRLQRGAAQGCALVIKIAITVEAFEAIAATLPLGSVA